MPELSWPVSFPVSVSYLKAELLEGFLDRHSTVRLGRSACFNLAIDTDKLTCIAYSREMNNL